MQEKSFKEREARMMEKNARLEESLASFSKYLQETDAKKARAGRRAADEARACEEKSEEAEKLVIPHRQSIVCRHQRLSLASC